MRELTEGALLAGRYTLVRPLARGGMGEVWLADDRRGDSRLALKFGGAALHKEWQTASRLMHANIVRVFEFHDEPDGAFFGMQYLAGPPVSVLSGLSLESILRPLAMIADALRYAHAKSIAHRDIKAANILLDTRGLPYLVDFGVAAAAGAALRGGGSPIAASPQQRAGEPPAAADDIYALGVLAAELISGTPPASSADIDGLKLASGDALPGAVRALLRDMLQADANARPDAQTVCQRLRDAGFPPGAAPGRALSAGVIDTDTVVSAAPRRPQRSRPGGPDAPAPAVSTATSDGGVSARSVYIGLGVLLLLFCAVIFVLPGAVDDPGSTPASVTEPGSPPDTVPGGAGETAIDDEAGDVAGTGQDLPMPPSQRPGAADDQGLAGFSENVLDPSLTTEEQIKAATDEVLGDLLSRLERLRFRAVDRWGGQQYLDALGRYEDGDRAYLRKDYRQAWQHYSDAVSMLEPLFARVEREFDTAFAAGKEAFANGDHIEAVRNYDLAAAISPGNAAAEAGLKRALSLKTVLDLMDQALQFESDLEFAAARTAFERVLEIDGAWQPAVDGLARVRESIRLRSFEQRMTEGLDALQAGDYASARAAFEAAKALDASSQQPVDGLLQVDQGIRLDRIAELEARAVQLENSEEWENAIGVYDDILQVDGDLQFAKEGLARSRQRAELHKALDAYIDNPDALSAPRTMQAATQLLLELSRVDPVGPRLADQKNALSRLLKRAATPLDVVLLSDNVTDVAIHRVAQLGTFETRELSMKPGNYVAVGSRPGYRDVRVEFRVAPEIEMKPIVVQCEEQI